MAILKVGVKTHRATKSCLGLLVAPLPNTLIDKAGMLMIGDEPIHAWIYRAQRLSLDLSASWGAVGSPSGGGAAVPFVQGEGQFSPQNRSSVSSDAPGAEPM